MPAGGGGGDAGITRRLSETYPTGYQPIPQALPEVFSRLRGLLPLAWWRPFGRGGGIRKRSLCRRVTAFGDSHRIQTCNLLIRSQMLYSVELANRCFAFAGAKLRQVSESAKFFQTFL